MRKTFPQNSRTEEELLAELRDRKSDDLAWKKGRAFSYVYYAEAAITETLKKAYLEYFSENALNPSAFPSLRKMEIEVIHMCLSLFEAPEQAVGSMTSGGTESILMAVKSAKEYAKINNPQIKHPEIIMPISAHPAFNKAMDYFGIKAVIVPIAEDYRVDAEVMKNAISPNTIMLVASAPSYPQGVVDPIVKIGEIALANQLLFHVDACVGGFVLPFIDDLPHSWNMSVPGVTSMSADIHKYGFASKGSSVILYNDPELRKSQFYIYTDWPGGMYGSPAIMGTKPGGAIAVAWTILQLLGNEGYKRMVAKSMATAARIQKTINTIDGLHVYAKPDMCIYSFGSDKFDIYELGDELHLKGWLLDRQQNPPAIHMSISPFHEHIVAEFEEDLRTSVQKLSRVNLPSLKKKVQLAANRGLKKLLPEKSYKRLQDVALKNSDVDNKRSAALYGLIGDLKGVGETEELIRNFLDKMMK